MTPDPADQVAAITALVYSEEAARFRDEAWRGVVDLPYASNRYIRLLDDIRAALRGEHPSPRTWT